VKFANLETRGCILF